jgi:outer membrane protein assembly factor BamB
MSKTAKRRWSRELESEVDGLAFSTTGPVLLHGYDPPAGGKWVDDVIPGKLGAFDRSTGERLWLVPCEVGYGRGFGAGIVSDSHVIVVGPSASGHRIVRQSLRDGELIDTETVPPFDHSVVNSDCVLLSTGRSVLCIDSLTLIENWTYEMEGERYHDVACVDGRAFVVYSVDKGYGILEINLETGDFVGVIVPPVQKPIRDLCGTPGVLMFLGSELDRFLPESRLGELTSAIALHKDMGARDSQSLVALDLKRVGDLRWFDVLETCASDDLPDISIVADGGKVYVARRAMLTARDAMTGRPLGDWTVPGLDEKVGFSVAAGAGLLGEETRVSLFELPA